MPDSRWHPPPARPVKSPPQGKLYVRFVGVRGVLEVPEEELDPVLALRSAITWAAFAPLVVIGFVALRACPPCA